ncbi:MAG: peptidoglycan bridge formation glycyltransferase FemA/FemB family protein [Anaerolineae bacterium]|nr:peptidoglycan bridge formation glycyltransferase FemA/FemB family protein [Anaerolineae bacterium]
MFKIIEPTPQQWDQFVNKQPRAHFLQQAAWGSLKSAFGWQAQRVALTDSDSNQIVAGAQILLQKLPANVGTLAYLPMGPYVTADNQWSTLWGAIHKRAQQHKAAFIKLEPGIYHGPNQTPPDFTQWGFNPSPQTVQPPRTILIDIRQPGDQIQARMNQGTRRKIRQSQKNDIRYYEGTRDDLNAFNTMMQATGQRNDFGVHEPAYFERMYDLFVPQDDAVLIMAEHEGDPLAGIIVFAKGNTAWYLAGASSETKRNLMATYGVQWYAIQWAKARGCKYYDLWGVPDEDADILEAQFQERSDGLWGVYGFKRGWGGEVVRSAGTWDRVYNSILYNGYKAALWLRG